MSDNDAQGSLWKNIHIASMDESIDLTYGAINDGAIMVDEGIITWVGKFADLSAAQLAGKRHFDGGGRWVTPGLIDCHTHIVYGGSRADEFEQRLSGLSYEEVAKRGGGIVSTVRATRAAGKLELLEAADRRLLELMAQGLTTIEIKSGYGLDIETEQKMLEVARALADRHQVQVKTTFLGAHTLPVEYAGRADAYIDFVCSQSLPAIAKAGLADAVDGFCETIGFTLAQTERVFEAAINHNLPVKLHAEQLSNLGGSKMAARFGALSVDHVEYLDEEGVAAIAASGTVAVLLPGAFYFLRETQRPPIELFRKHGVKMALATDTNPGSSPVSSIVLMLSMGCTFFQMTPAECLAGLTRNAALALGISDQVGTISVGKHANFVLWDIEQPADLAYRIGHNPCHQVVYAGVVRN